jgi:predicted nuclease with TOPRIM domain|tara:strand:+ start:198 stop:473 length:276 start_codon:yes stop_codon:yes gene_type:complete
MSDPIKFTEDEMKKIKEFQESYVTIQQNLGQISISELRLNQQLKALGESEVELKNKFVEVQQDEKSFIEEITKKYGDGTLDPNSGQFIPNK